MSGRISHQRIVEHLRVRINGGALKRGDRLPSFEQLHRQFGVAPRTVSKALGVLELDGLVTRRPGSGVYVSDVGARKQYGRIAIAGTPLIGYPSDYWARLLSGIQSAAHEYGLEAAFMARQVDVNWADYGGVIWYAPYPRDLEEVRANGLSAVVIGGQMPGTHSVMIDEFEAGYVAGRHLIDLGHHRIGFMGWMTSVPFNLRQAGYIMAMSAIDSEPDPIRVKWQADHPDVFPAFDYRLIRPMGFSHTSFASSVCDLGYINMRQWIDDGFPELGCTAIIAPNDDQAAGVIRCLVEAGYRVPEDVSVVGFDNEREYATSSLPITSIAADMFSLGAEAVRMLHRQMDRETAPLAATVPVSLYARRSTASPGGSN